ncbi:transposon tf2-9 polyprotein [Plakobranchus ocellatus]|uniref:Transposon tf2-9 polyprotein n=1 Tax=Plakobranchus ocellatus TaxID=259542 RepID=A0AAV3ZLH2_9GAST|nr:transposon tf2-9 polyprotein [Plakobranchus ocellatus]
MQRMEQLTRSAIYWPRIDTDIEDIARHCAACNEHKRLSPKEPSNPWITQEKLWSRVPIDQSINYRSLNWLVMMDVFSKYACFHIISSISNKTTTPNLDEDLLRFGYSHAIVTDNATCFSFAEFQTWLEQKNIQHLHGASQHPGTNIA